MCHLGSHFKESWRNHKYSLSQGLLGERERSGGGSIPALLQETDPKRPASQPLNLALPQHPSPPSLLASAPKHCTRLPSRRSTTPTRPLELTAYPPKAGALAPNLLRSASQDPHSLPRKPKSPGSQASFSNLCTTLQRCSHSTGAPILCDLPHHQELGTPKVRHPTSTKPSDIQVRNWDVVEEWEMGKVEGGVKRDVCRGMTGDWTSWALFSVNRIKCMGAIGWEMHLSWRKQSTQCLK